MPNPKNRSPRQNPAATCSADSKETPLDAEAMIEQLIDELRATKKQLKARVEQYESSNEKLKASNEELQSIYEELRFTSRKLEVEDRIDGEVIPFDDMTSRSAAEAQQKKEKDLAELYLDVAGVMMVALDRTGHVTMINRAGCKILGYPEDEIVGKDWFAHFLPERDREPVREVFEALLSGQVEAVEHYENTVLTRSGRERLVLWQNTILRDEQGEVIGTLGSGTDITERKQAERALEASQQQLRALYDNAQDAFMLTDDDAHYVDCNPAACALLGYGRDELLRETVASLSGGQPADLFEERWQDFLSSGAQHGEYQLRRKDGRIIDVEYRAVADVLPGLHLSVLRDVTERKQREHALRESEERFRNLFEASPDAIFVEDLAGNVLDVNRAACHLHNAERDTLIGLNVRDLVPPDQQQIALRDFDRLVRGEASHLQAHSWTMSRHAIPVEIRANRFVYDGQDALLLHVRNISDRRHLEQEVLRISEEERQRIGQDIHDGLASQFSGMALLSRGLVNRLKKGQPISPEMLEELSQLARSGAEQARALARGLHPVKLDREGLQAALKELVHSAEILSGLSYTLDMDDTLPLLASNVAPQLYRIAQEAVTNAVRHAGASTLLLRLRREGDHLVLTVRDDGVGLLEEAKEAGGMGLHIMPYRARMVGATLRIDSAPGAGTCVTCSLPLSTAIPDENT